MFGFLIAPIAPALPFALIGQIGAGASGFMLPMKVAVLLGYPVAIVIGVPLHLYFVRRNITGLLAYGVAGLLLGVAAYMAFIIPAVLMQVTGTAGRDASTMLYQISVTLPLAPLASIAGGIAALVFWFVGRPDLSPLRPHGGAISSLDQNSS